MKVSNNSTRTPDKTVSSRHGESTSCWFSKDEKRLFRSSCANRQLLVSTIKQHLREHFSNPQSMDALAREMCLSPRTLSRRLRAVNCHFRDLKAEVMLELASDYLANTDEPVNTIARHLGYNDASNFCKAFRRWTGSTPRRYREQHGSPYSLQ
ncbi:MAG: AraC family transcriptional regulator [Pseudomonadota bacterium]|nr:AraC family transcriptional regulator [Pseudomonadota bacterium]